MKIIPGNADKANEGAKLRVDADFAGRKDAATTRTIFAAFAAALPTVAAAVV